MFTTSTNIYIQSRAANYSWEQDAKLTDETEIKSVIGLLILPGFYRLGHQNLRDLWDQNGLGDEIFHIAMSLNWFLFLVQYMCFDDIRDHLQRWEVDRLTPIRDIFELFISNCEKNYTVSEYTPSINSLFLSEENVVAVCIFQANRPNMESKYSWWPMPEPGIHWQWKYMQGNNLRDLILYLIHQKML